MNRDDGDKMKGMKNLFRLISLLFKLKTQYTHGDDGDEIHHQIDLLKRFYY